MSNCAASMPTLPLSQHLRLSLGSVNNTNPLEGNPQIVWEKIPKSHFINSWLICEDWWLSGREVIRT